MDKVNSDLKDRKVKSSSSKGKAVDDIARYNKERWEEIAAGNVGWSRPMLDLTEESAWQLINQEGIDLDVQGKDVLCLGAGGGQQSAAFGVLGANVSVLDLSELMLRRDIEAARHYGHPIRVEQGDMRDLTIFEDESFNIVWGTGIGFIPDVRPVIEEAARILRPNGHFHTNFSNPYFMGVWERQYELPAYRDGKNHWDEVDPPPWEGYLFTEPYVEGVEIDIGTPIWEIGESDDEMVRVKAPKTFRHTFSTVVNLLVENNFHLLGLWEDPLEDKLDDEPGSYGHWISIIPDGATIWAKKELPQRLCKHVISK